MPWLHTKDAEKCLAVSASLLRRYRDDHGGFLIEREDYRFGGPGKTSPILWNTDSIEEKFHYRGRRLRQLEAAADREIKSLLNKYP